MIHGTVLNPICLLIASVFPDCDTRRSLIGKLMPLWKLPFVTHRGMTHTFWFLAVTSVTIGLFFNLLAGISWAIGYATHLFLDATTPMGIRFFSLWGVKSKGRFR